MTAIIILFSFLGMVGCIGGIIRTDAVAKYRMDLLDQIKIAATSDVMTGKHFEWRYFAFQEVSFNEMVFKFWRPLNWFYPDKQFCEPGEPRI